MSKFIYGLAMPFKSSYWEYELLTNTFKFELTNRESVTFWKEIVLTLNHDYSKVIGTTDRNLSLKVTNEGVFFRLIVDTKEGLKARSEVSKGTLNHCSISYLHRSVREPEEEQRVEQLGKLLGWDEKFVVTKYKEILVEEICLTNNPANDETFCTTNRNDPRLKGVRFVGHTSV